jgi:hypothetical protein
MDLSHQVLPLKASSPTETVAVGQILAPTHFAEGGLGGTDCYGDRNERPAVLANPVRRGLVAATLAAAGGNKEHNEPDDRE